MEIKAEEIKATIEQLLEYQRKLGRDSFSLPYDYYWNIPKEQRYEPYSEPDSSKFTLGQLSWDLANIQETLRETKEPSNLHFVFLGQLLIAIGEAIPEYKENK